MIVSSATQSNTTTAQTGRQEIAASGGRATPRAPVETGSGERPAAVHSAVNVESAELAATRQKLQQHFDTYIAEHDQEARFSVDKGTGMTIVQIYNRTSGEMVRQIPTEEVVRIAQFLDAQSTFVNVTA